MLVLSRKLGETILIGKDVAVTVVRLEGRCVRLGVEAPDHTVVLRKEAKERGDGERFVALMRERLSKRRLAVTKPT